MRMSVVEVDKVKEMVLELYVYFLKKSGYVVKYDTLYGGAGKDGIDFIIDMIESFISAIVFVIAILIMFSNGEVSDFNKLLSEVISDPEAVVNNIIENNQRELSEATEMINQSEDTDLDLNIADSDLERILRIDAGSEVESNSNAADLVVESNSSAADLEVESNSASSVTTPRNDLGGEVSDLKYLLDQKIDGPSIDDIERELASFAGFFQKKQRTLRSEPTAFPGITNMERSLDDFENMSNSFDRTRRRNRNLTEYPSKGGSRKRRQKSKRKGRTSKKQKKRSQQKRRR
jgi:hypothetical protein